MGRMVARGHRADAARRPRSPDGRIRCSARCSALFAGRHLGSGLGWLLIVVCGAVGNAARRSRCSPTTSVPSARRPRRSRCSRHRRRVRVATRLLPRGRLAAQRGAGVRGDRDARIHRHGGREHRRRRARDGFRGRARLRRRRRRVRHQTPRHRRADPVRHRGNCRRRLCLVVSGQSRPDPVIRSSASVRVEQAFRRDHPPRAFDEIRAARRGAPDRAGSGSSDSRDSGRSGKNASGAACNNICRSTKSQRIASPPSASLRSRAMILPFTLIAGVP